MWMGYAELAYYWQLWQAVFYCIRTPINFTWFSVNLHSKSDFVLYYECVLFTYFDFWVWNYQQWRKPGLSLRGQLSPSLSFLLFCFLPFPPFLSVSHLHIFTLNKHLPVSFLTVPSSPFSPLPQTGFECLWERVSSFSRVCGKAPSEIEFGVF